jgi:hypothetical protein
LRQCRWANLGGGSLPTSQHLYECTQGADLDLRQRGPWSFVTEQVLRFLEQVHELLARGELHQVVQGPRMLSLVHTVPGVGAVRDLFFRRGAGALRAPLRHRVGVVRDPVRGPAARSQLADRSRKGIRVFRVRGATGRRRPNRLDPGGNLGLRIDLGDQPQELPLAPEPRTPQELRMPLSTEVWPDHQHTGEMDLSLRDGIVELGVLANEPRRLRASVGGVFTHSQFIDAVGVQRRAGPQAMDASPLHLAEMNQQVGQRDVRSRGQTLHCDEQIIVRNGSERIVMNHVAAYTRDPNAPTLPQGRRSCPRTAQDSNRA